MFRVVALCVGIGLSMGLAQFFFLGGEERADSVPFEGLEAGIGTENDVCVLHDPSLDLQFVVAVSMKSLPEKIDGQYEYATHNIYFSDKKIPDVGTMAHEANHAVKDMVSIYSIYDDHYEAYAQGYLTECLYQIVMRWL